MKSSLKLITAIIILYLLSLLAGCGAMPSALQNKKKSNIRNAPTEQVSVLQAEYDTRKEKEGGWPSEIDCDGALFAGVLRRAGIGTVDMTQAITPQGRPLRRPNQDCGPTSEGLPGDSAATTSSDMVLGIVLGLHAAEDINRLETLYQYGKDNNWVMGKPTSLVSRVLLKPTGIGMIAQAIKDLGGKDHVERFLPNPILPVEKDYEEHLQILSVLLQRDIGRDPGLPGTCDSRKEDALIQAVCGDYALSTELLLGEYKYPTYVRGEVDASTEAYKRTHWLLAAKVILEGAK